MEMYCPRCAAENSEDTKYCRACGANVSLVPQAMTGKLSEPRHTRRRHRHGRDDDGPPSLAGGIQKLFVGIGFILVAIAARFFAPAGAIWWFWLLIPAFATLGKGVAELLTVKTSAMPPPMTNQTAVPPARTTNDLPPPRQLYDPLQPPSVTEGTTRHLDPAKDSYNERR